MDIMLTLRGGVLRWRKWIRKTDGAITSYMIVMTIVSFIVLRFFFFAAFSSGANNNAEQYLSLFFMSVGAAMLAVVVPAAVIFTPWALWQTFQPESRRARAAERAQALFQAKTKIDGKEARRLAREQELARSLRDDVEEYLTLHGVNVLAATVKADEFVSTLEIR